MRESRSQRQIDQIIKIVFNDNAKAFAERTGLSVYSVSRMRTGKVSIDKHMEKIISTVPEVKESWLRTGRGPMLNNRKLSTEDYLKKIEQLESQVATLTKQLSLMQETMELYSSLLRKSRKDFRY